MPAIVPGHSYKTRGGQLVVNVHRRVRSGRGRAREIMQRELIEKLEGLPVTFVTPDRFAIVGGTPHDDGSQMQGFQCGKCGGRCKFGQLNEFICGRKDCPLGV